MILVNILVVESSSQTNLRPNSKFYISKHVDRKLEF